MNMTNSAENLCRAITPPQTTPNSRLLIKIVMCKQCYTTDNVLIISKDMLLYFYVFSSVLWSPLRFPHINYVRFVLFCLFCFYIYKLYLRQPPRYNWNIVESGVKYHKRTNTTSSKFLVSRKNNKKIVSYIVSNGWIWI